jgi:hypothetical protein
MEYSAGHKYLGERRVAAAANPKICCYRSAPGYLQTISPTSGSILNIWVWDGKTAVCFDLQMVVQFGLLHRG